MKIKDQIRKQRNDAILVELKKRTETEDCDILQQQNDSDSGYFIFVKNLNKELSAENIESIIVSTIYDLFPEEHFFIDKMIERENYVIVGFMHIDEYFRKN